MTGNLDTIVRVVGAVLILVIVVVSIDNVRLLIESNEGKKYTKARMIRMPKPKIAAENLLREPPFFLMINHGPDLCKIEADIKNVPYYKGKSCLSVLGEHNDKD